VREAEDNLRPFVTVSTSTCGVFNSTLNKFTCNFSYEELLLKYELAIGKEYEIMVEAVNLVGTGEASSVNMTFATVPGQSSPPVVEVNYQKEETTFKVFEPLNTGGIPVLGYEIKAR